jgi:hypothetical protein
MVPYYYKALLTNLKYLAPANEYNIYNKWMIITIIYPISQDQKLLSWLEVLLCWELGTPANIWRFFKVPCGKAPFYIHLLSLKITDFILVFNGF